MEPFEATKDLKGIIAREDSTAPGKVCKVLEPAGRIGEAEECLVSASLQRRTVDILVVDDEALMRQLNTKLLSNAGYHVEAAEDGAVAWDMLQLRNYDLLITDHNMPKVSGAELIGKVHAAGMSLPVILATGSSPEEGLNLESALQPTATLLKPYTAVEFLETVKKVLAQASA